MTVTMPTLCHKQTRSITFKKLAVERVCARRHNSFGFRIYFGIDFKILRLSDFTKLELSDRSS